MLYIHSQKKQAPDPREIYFATWKFSPAQVFHARVNGLHFCLTYLNDRNQASALPVPSTDWELHYGDCWGVFFQSLTLPMIGRSHAVAFLVPSPDWGPGTQLDHSAGKSEIQVQTIAGIRRPWSQVSVFLGRCSNHSEIGIKIQIVPSTSSPLQTFFSRTCICYRSSKVQSVDLK